MVDNILCEEFPLIQPPFFKEYNPKCSSDIEKRKNELFLTDEIMFPVLSQDAKDLIATLKYAWCYKVVAITFRPPKLQLKTSLWCFENDLDGCFFCYESSSKDKIIEQLGISIFIEDCPSEVIKIARTTEAHVYLMDAPYNKIVENYDLQIERVFSLKEVMEKIIERSK